MPLSASREMIAARYANLDAAAMLADRLGPAQLRWLIWWFHCPSGCAGGARLAGAAPILDTQLAQFCAQAFEETECPHCAQGISADRLFVAGLLAGSHLNSIANPEPAFQELLESTANYQAPPPEADHQGICEWSNELLGQVIAHDPRLSMALKTLMRAANTSQQPAGNLNISEVMAGLRKERTGLGAGIILFFFAGALAAGVQPGIANHPYLGSDDDPWCLAEDDEEEDFQPDPPF